MTRSYTDPNSFRQALQDRLRSAAIARARPAQELFLKIVIERLLARLFASPNPPWLLKGGLAMDMRFRPRARTTRDVDLELTVEPATNEGMHDALNTAATRDLRDHFRYRLSESDRPIDQSTPARISVEASIGARIAARFHIDIGVAVATSLEPDVLDGDDLLDFAAIPRARVLAIPASKHFAEKLHAYCRSRGKRVNSRVKDLIDMVLLIERGAVEPAAVQRAVSMVFAELNEPVPNELPKPPDHWEQEFAAIARTVEIGPKESNEAAELVRRFLRATPPSV